MGMHVYGVQYLSIINDISTLNIICHFATRQLVYVSRDQLSSKISDNRSRKWVWFQNNIYDVKSNAVNERCLIERFSSYNK